MEPLDLTKTPPREPRQELDGIAFMPRTIDKLRAKLPGGKLGTYLTHEGISPVLLRLICVEEQALLAAVASAGSEQEVAAWLREHADPSRYEKANAILSNLTDAEVTSDLRETFEKFYGGRDPGMKLFDILDWDDRRNFPDLAPAL